MTLPSSGTMTSAQLAQELYGSSGASVTVPDADTRALAGKPSGAVVFPTDFYGKSKGTVGTVTVDSSTRRYVAYSWVSSPGKVGSTSPLNMSVAPGVGSAAGQVGEILSLQWSVNVLQLYVRGNGSDDANSNPGSFSSLSQVPFTTMKINGVAYNKANATLRSGYILDFSGVADPFSGASLTHTIEFT